MPKTSTSSFRRAVRKGAGVTPAPSDARARAALRRRLADAAESIIALLDALDGDAEAEDDGTAEPGLGWMRTMAWGSLNDREEDHTPVESEG